jgi:hypothetical protein
MVRKRNWPSREAWTKSRRSPAGRMPNASDRIADYATPDEIDELKAAMRERLKKLGLKPARDEDARLKRRCINRGLKLLNDGELPFTLEAIAGAEDLLAPFHARYNAAASKLAKRALEEIARTPVDDAAWEAELKWRAKVEG